jgi:hypothetical protein
LQINRSNSIKYNFFVAFSEFSIYLHFCENLLIFCVLADFLQIFNLILIPTCKLLLICRFFADMLIFYVFADLSALWTNSGFAIFADLWIIHVGLRRYYWEISYLYNYYKCHEFLCILLRLWKKPV